MRSVAVRMPSMGPGSYRPLTPIRGRRQSRRQAGAAVSGAGAAVVTSGDAQARARDGSGETT